MNNPTLLAASIIRRLDDFRRDTANAESVIRAEIEELLRDNRPDPESPVTGVVSSTKAEPQQ